MGYIRRLNPLSWCLRTINIVFGTLLTIVGSATLIFATTSFASEPPIALLSIGSANLSNAEIISAPPDGRTLPTPEHQIGLYQPYTDLTFLYGHNTTIFTDLHNVNLGDQITFRHLETRDLTTYQVTDIQTLKNSNVHMGQLLAKPSEKTLILMTCAGQFQDSLGTYDERLIIWAIKT